MHPRSGRPECLRSNDRRVGLYVRLGRDFFLALGVFLLLTILSQGRGVAIPTDGGALWPALARSVAPAVAKADGPPLILTPTTDTSIDQAHPSTNYGSSTVLTLTSAAGANSRALLKFDVSGIPAGATVGRVELQLYSDAGNKRLVEVHKISSDWVTNTVDWNSQPSINPTASDTQKTKTDTTAWLVTADVQSWLNDPSSNRGFLLKDSSEDANPSSTEDFHSKEYAPGGSGPVLWVYYVDAAMDVTPATAVASQPKAYAATITNTAGLLGDQIDAITLTIPSGYSEIPTDPNDVNCGIGLAATPPSRVWTITAPPMGSNGPQTLAARASIGETNPLRNGESLQVEFGSCMKSPSEARTYTWTAEAHGLNQGTEVMSKTVSIVTPPHLVYEAGTLSPVAVSQGQAASFTLQVTNTGRMDAILSPAGSRFTFSDSTHLYTYTAALGSTLTVPGVHTGTLAFVSAQVPLAMPPGSYSATMDLAFTDINRTSYSQTGIDAGSLAVETAPQLAYVSGLSPTSVSQNQTVTFTVQVINTGQAAVNLSTDSLFKFGMGAHSYVANLAPPITVPPGTTLTSLHFQGSLVSPDIPAGAYPVTLDLRGTYSSGASYQDSVAASSLTVQTAPQLAYSTGLSPVAVSQGQTASFTLVISNTGEAGVTLSPGSVFRFTDGVRRYEAPLSITTTVPGLYVGTLVFAPTSVPSAMNAQLYSGSQLPAIDLVGTDSNGAPYSQAGIGLVPLTVQTAPLLAYKGGTLSPTTVGPGQSVSFALEVTNQGNAAPVTLGTGSLLHFDDGAHFYTATLRADTSVPTGSAGTYLTFTAALVPPAMISDTNYTPLMLLEGADGNSASPYHVILASDPLRVQSPTAVGIVSMTANTGDTETWRPPSDSLWALGLGSFPGSIVALGSVMILALAGAAIGLARRRRSGGGGGSG